MLPSTFRVFVSSTFRDMQDEREELVKRVFPLLRRLCEQRGVAWGEVDLRWGITQDQAERGAVVPICLDEIDRCQLFLGLLGERYGWVPTPADLRASGESLARYPWVERAVAEGRSVTEMEIRYGALDRPSRALFYFRSPSSPESAAAPETDPAGRRKLADLKETVRRSGLPVHEDYRDAQELGELVLADCGRILEELFPARALADPLDREAAAHTAFASRRTRVFVGRDAYLHRLDEHLEGADPPLVVTGPSGAGKSALLANWLARLAAAGEMRAAHLLVHFVGSSPASAGCTAMLRRLLAELHRRFFPGEPAPRGTAPEDDVPAGLPQVETQFLRAELLDWLRDELLRWLGRAAGGGKLLLVLDGLDQLRNEDHAHELGWLPEHFPANVRVVLAVSPGRCLVALKRRGWPALELEGLHANSEYRAREVYRRVLDRPGEHSDAGLAALYELLTELGEETAEELAGHFYLPLGFGRSGMGELTGIIQAAVQACQGDVAGALAVLDRREAEVSKEGNLCMLQPVLRLRAVLLQATGDPIGALVLQRENERVCRLLGRKDQLADSLHAQAGLCRQQGDHAQALALSAEQEWLVRELGGKERPPVGREVRAPASARGWLCTSLARVCRLFRRKSAREGRLASPAVLDLVRSDLEKGLAVERRAERFCLDWATWGDPALLGLSLRQQGAILRCLAGDPLAPVREQERQARAAGDAALLRKCLGEKARLLALLSETDQALAAWSEQASLCRQAGDGRALCVCLAYQTACLGRPGDEDRLRACQRELAEVNEGIGNVLRPVPPGTKMTFDEGWEHIGDQRDRARVWRERRRPQ